MAKLFKKPIKEMADDDLLCEIDNDIPWGMLHIPIGELTRRNLEKLKDVIERFNKQSSRQTDKIIKLTWVIVGLTFVMVVGLGIQIYLAKIQTYPAMLEKQKNNDQAWDYCKNNPDSTWPKLENGEFQCSEVLKMLKNKYE